VQLSKIKTVFTQTYTHGDLLLSMVKESQRSWTVEPEPETFKLPNISNLLVMLPIPSISLDESFAPLVDSLDLNKVAWEYKTVPLSRKLPDITMPVTKVRVKFDMFQQVQYDEPKDLLSQLVKLVEKAEKRDNELSEIAVKRIAAIRMCIQMLQHGGTLRLIEGYLLHIKDYQLLDLIVPKFQSQLIVNEEQLCSDRTFRQVVQVLGDRKTCRIRAIERPLDNVSLILDQDTAVFISSNIDIKDIVKWIATQGSKRFARFFLVLLPPDGNIMLDAVLATYRLSVCIPTTIRVFKTPTQAAYYLRYLMINHSKLSHTEADQIQETFDTLHEQMFRAMPHLNGLKAYHLATGRYTNPGESTMRWFLAQNCCLGSNFQ